MIQIEDSIGAQLGLDFLDNVGKYIIKAYKPTSNHDRNWEPFLAIMAIIGKAEADLRSIITYGYGYPIGSLGDSEDDIPF